MQDAAWQLTNKASVLTTVHDSCGLVLIEIRAPARVPPWQPRCNTFLKYCVLSLSSPLPFHYLLRHLYDLGISQSSHALQQRGPD